MTAYGISWHQQRQQRRHRDGGGKSKSDGGVMALMLMARSSMTWRNIAPQAASYSISMPRMRWRSINIAAVPSNNNTLSIYAVKAAIKARRAACGENQHGGS